MAPWVVGRRPRAASIAPVTWRDGVHLTGTPIWCDARRRRDICFVSSADRVGRTGHGQLIGSPTTLALLAARGDGHLAVPLRQRFTLGTLRLELIPSGRGLGAAALHVDAVGRTVLYAGALRTVASSWYEAAEVRACDALVIDAPLGEPHHELEPLDDVAGRVIEWTREQLAAGLPTVLVVDSALDGIEVATRLLAEGVPVAASKPPRPTGRSQPSKVRAPQSRRRPARICSHAAAIGSSDCLVKASHLASAWSTRAPPQNPAPHCSRLFFVSKTAPSRQSPPGAADPDFVLLLLHPRGEIRPSGESF